MKKAARRNDWSFLPNLLTTGNLLSGAASLYFALQGEFLWAGMCIYLGMIMDVLDGFTAQRLGIATPFGIEYDSLADFLTFGVAPAFLAYRYALAPLTTNGHCLGTSTSVGTGRRGHPLDFPSPPFPGRSVWELCLAGLTAPPGPPLASPIFAKAPHARRPYASLPWH